VGGIDPLEFSRDASPVREREGVNQSSEREREGVNNTTIRAFALL
jgi:hypothetical protein